MYPQITNGEQPARAYVYQDPPAYAGIGNRVLDLGDIILEAKANLMTFLVPFWIRFALRLIPIIMVSTSLFFGLKSVAANLSIEGLPFLLEAGSYVFLLMPV